MVPAFAVAAVLETAEAGLWTAVAAVARWRLVSLCRVPWGLVREGGPEVSDLCLAAGGAGVRSAAGPSWKSSGGVTSSEVEAEVMANLTKQSIYTRGTGKRNSPEYFHSFRSGFLFYYLQILD